MRHLPTSFLSPPHSSPPFFGGGSLHFLVRVWVPYPHVTLQGDHDDQRPQWPSTGTKRVEVHLSFSRSISIMVNGSFWAKSRLKVCGLSRMVLQASRAMLEYFGLVLIDAIRDVKGSKIWGWLSIIMIVLTGTAMRTLLCLCLYTIHVCTRTLISILVWTVSLAIMKAFGIKLITGTKTCPRTPAACCCVNIRQLNEKFSVKKFCSCWLLIDDQRVHWYGVISFSYRQHITKQTYESRRPLWLKGESIELEEDRMAFHNKSSNW